MSILKRHHVLLSLQLSLSINEESLNQLNEVSKKFSLKYEPWFCNETYQILVIIQLT